MSALGSLVVKLALEYAQFTQGLDKNEQAALKNAKSVQAAYDKMAGAVEERFQSVKTSIAGAVAGVVSVAGLIAVGQKIREETINAEKEQAQLTAALRSTGEAAGWSQDQLNDMATAMSKATTYSAGEVNQAQARLLAYVNITGEQVPRAVRAAMDMGTRLEMNLNQSMETVAKALDKPSTGMQSLQRQGFKFTESQIEMAKALENSGRLADAQAIVFAELESSYGGAAEAARDTLGGALTAVSNTINDLLTADSASLPALRNSVEELNQLLNSDASKAAFSFYVQLMVSMATNAGKLAVALADLRNGGLGSLLGHATADNAGSELVSIEGKLNKMRADAAAVDPSKGFTNKLNDFLFGDYGDLQRQIGVLENQREVLLRTVNASEGLGKSYEDLAADNDVLVASLAGTVEQLGKQGVLAGQTDAYLKKYGTSAQKAAIEIAEMKAKLGDAFTPEMEAKIRAVYEAQDKGGRSAAQSAKQLQSAYDSTVKSLDEKIAAQQLELATSEKLKDSAKLRIKFEQDLKGSLSGLNEASRQNIEVRLKTIETLEEEIEAQQKLAKLAEEERAFRKQWWTDQAKTVEELQAGNKALSEEIELIGRSAQEQAMVLQLREQAILLTKEQQLAEMQRVEDAAGFMSRERIALEQEIELRRERLALTSTKISRESSAAATAASVAEWQQGVAQIGQSLSDQLMDGGRNFGDYLKNLARTLVFKPIIQAIVQPVGNSVAGAMGVQLPTNASGMGNMFGLLQSGWMSDFGGTAVNQLGSWGADLWMKGFEKVGSGMINLSSSLQSVSGTIGSLGNVLGYGKALLDITKGNWGSGLGTAVGTWFGGPIGGAIGSTLGGLIDGLFGSGGTQEYGGTAMYSAAQGTQTSSAGGAFGTGFGGVAAHDQILANVAGISKSIVDALDSTAKSFGKTVGYEAAAGFASDFGDDATWGGLRIALGGKDIVNWNDNRQTRWAPKEFASGDEGYKQYLQAVATDVRSALLGMDLPGWANQLVSATGDLDAINAALQQIGATKALFDSWGQSMEMFKDISGEFQTQLIATSGSMDALAGNVSAFYQGFYSEQERMAQLNDQLRGTLSSLDIGIDPALGDHAKEQFRATVEAAFASGNGELGAQLLSLTSIFVTAADYAQKAAEDSVARLNSILGEQHLLWADLAEAQGDHATAAQRRYWVETAGMTAAEQAAYDYNASIRAQVSAAQAASASLQTLSDREWELENQRLTLQGQTGLVESRTRDKELAQLLEGVTDEDKRRQITAAYDYNTALQKQIESMQAAQQAASAAATAQQQAADSMRNSWQQAVDSMLNEAKRLRGEVAGNGAEGLAAAQAEFAITYAQAMAGDQEAARLLPALSKAVSDLGQSNVGSSMELALLRADLAEQLERLASTTAASQGFALPAFADGGYYAGGAALVGERGPEIINFRNPGYIYDANQTARLLSGAAPSESIVMGQVLSELQGLRREFQQFRVDRSRESGDLVRHTRRTADVLQRVERQDGLAVAK